MTECERWIEVEDLVLGLLGAAEAREVAEHLAMCACCKQSKTTFVSERGLFERRAEALPPPPPIAFSVIEQRLSGSTLVRARAAMSRATSAFVAVAACAAALFGLRTSSPRLDCTERRTPAAVSTTSTSAPSSSSSEESLACGASGPSSSRNTDVFASRTEETELRDPTSSERSSVIASSQSEGVGLACVVDRATCDEPAWLRETSVLATP
ncbi:MAG TPA: hypothetical protein VM925_21555 [Labilithrix sp.]|nr:hypothetical protein [Labilithrix sp.]